MSFRSIFLCSQAASSVHGKVFLLRTCLKIVVDIFPAADAKSLFVLIEVLIRLLVDVRLFLLQDRHSTAHVEWQMRHHQNDQRLW